LALKLPQLQPLERSHLLMEAVACGRRDSLIHASVGKQRRYHVPKPDLIQGATCLGALSIALKSLVFLNVVLSLASS